MKFEYNDENWFFSYDDTTICLCECDPKPKWETLRRAAILAHHPDGVSPLKWPKRKRERMADAARQAVGS